MSQAQSLKKLLQGQSLHQKDQKEIVDFFSKEPKLNLNLFSQKNKLEISIFEKYIKNSSFTECCNRYREAITLILNEKTNQAELKQLKIFNLLDKLVQSVEVENNLKINLYKQLNEIKEVRELNESTKNEILNLAVGLSIKAIAYNKK